MRECEKRIENLPFLSIDVSPIFAQEDGFRKGWKAALKWILQKEHVAKLNEGERFVFTNFIEKELEE